MRLHNINEAVKQVKPKGFATNIEKETLKNKDFRRVLFTTPHMQLVVMSLKPGEDIGAETHSVAQFIRVDAGKGEATINGKTTQFNDGDCVVIPADAEHNITNIGNEPLQLYTVYAPPHHHRSVVHKTKTDAQQDEEHFDGKSDI